MKPVMKWIRGILIGLVALGILVVCAAFLAVSDTTREFVKSDILPLIKEYHPLRHIRVVAQSVKSALHKKEYVDQSVKPNPSEIFAGSRAEKDKDLITWIAPFSDRISPYIHPSSSQIHLSNRRRPFTIVGLRGETLSFQVVLRSSSNLGHLRVRLSSPGCCPIC